jgi:hypothetical protein
MVSCIMLPLPTIESKLWHVPLRIMLRITPRRNVARKNGRLYLQEISRDTVPCGLEHGNVRLNRSDRETAKLQSLCGSDFNEKEPS